ncbi:flagellar hook basal-body protein, partial [Thioclava sp. BHET1]
GQGWFSYQTAAGQTAYGRDGRLTIDAQGDLVTMSGAKLLDSGGSPIAIPVATGSRISIAGDGSITDDQGVNIGKVGVYAIPDASSYQRIGSGMMIPPDGSATTASIDTDPHVSQGFIEQSNVQPVLEMTRMMEIQRAYERAMKLMEDQDTLRQQVLTQLGQIG